MQGGFNRWTHKKKFGPLKMTPPEGEGSHFSAMVRVPRTAHAVDFVLSNVPEGEGVYENRGGLDYHLPVEGSEVRCNACLELMHVLTAPQPSVQANYGTGCPSCSIRGNVVAPCTGRHLALLYVLSLSKMSSYLESGNMHAQRPLPFHWEPQETKIEIVLMLQLEPPGLHVVHVAVEMAPICKVGGLGDVVTALGRAVQEQGHMVEVILPRSAPFRNLACPFPSINMHVTMQQGPGATSMP